MYHTPVFESEILTYMAPIKGGKYIDCTLGDAGHASKLLEKGCFVLGIDCNEFSLSRAEERLKEERLDKNFIGVKGNFKDILAIALENGFTDVDGIIYDLGFSSSQVESGESGISFTNELDAPLDMRLDKNLGVTAADLLNTLSEQQLAQMFYVFGGERMAKKFAVAIVRFRGSKKFNVIRDLVDLLVSEAPSGYEKGRIHPATRVFQALRIVVNDELANLENSLPQAACLLKLPRGRMAVISFHSLEDKVVKDFGRQYMRPASEIRLDSLTKKPLVPSDGEVRNNRRARSAKLRVFERVA
ncbi:16S rRNA (cytosine(1402)-N(4))-methyltransferase RsmH [Candidatus Nomurabacteria bacterium]|uniref:Ribosomal RNA small subunit methyltransferase H n=1 Tax=candidate division WWE3 bacterium TaxID=2053526 RepID=A0A955E0H4_UNCKA|nr:16S rRNA (cytosine(1402)-N(4))-methyltransferase RsmH [candidate division WWE3 bacterium]MCB9824119.1 16S rRNA (cytosine(1402)-N(4))-methyltransferase RsmH [Candidatus Nomurabacteria bacterium]MCB9826910.1 16S rRNA (cytosine(1402)-N(4))-methyltransferase RsmH [Candidatus Nomurabacteria bacterium]MCB9828060.1 16S rRNA (cytosine(1402)-N(4))-methyltransferase RsmH [Candidatus Nomurabacteria bacterium]HXK52707.1 16S rRNA (cytosine(1402)-N(4))-methyltransferase RsmH [bacterium]